MIAMTTTRARPATESRGYERRLSLECGLRFDGQNRFEDRLVHGGKPSKIVSLRSPTTSRRAKPNWSMS